MRGEASSGRQPQPQQAEPAMSDSDTLAAYLYMPNDDPQLMFALPRYVIQSGRMIVEEGEIRASPIGNTHFVQPEYDPAVEAHIAKWFERAYTVRFCNYPVGELSGHACPKR